jgi:hypothetical protein
MLLPYAGAQMDAWTKGLPASGTRVRMAAVMLCAASVFVGLALLAYVPNMPPQLHARLWNVAPVSPLLPEERKALEVLKDRARPGERFILDGSDFSRNVLFSLDPAICEHWFDSLRLVTLTPDGIVDYLKASAPGILLHDKMNPPFEAVLNQRAPDKAGFRTRALYSAARFALYELIPAQSVPAPH